MTLDLWLAALTAIGLLVYLVAVLILSLIHISEPRDRG